LAWTIQDTTAISESQSADVFRVFVGRDNFTNPPWFTQKFWADLYNVIEYRNRDQNPHQGQQKWAAEHLARAHSYLVSVLATGIADNWPGFDQSQFLGNNRFARIGDEGSERPGSNYPDMYLPTYADIFSEDPLFDREGIFPGIPELEGRVQDTFIFPPDRLDMREAFVAFVIDGDTIETTDGERIRLVGINAPELPTKAGEFSQLILERVLAGKQIFIEDGENPIDDFGRTLAYIWLGDVMINQFMVGAGFARPTNFQDNTQYKEFFDDTEAAKKKVYGSSGANGFNRGRILPIWRTFCPRWKDLGIKPPYEVRAAYASIEEAQNQLARQPVDFVEPGFFYWRSSWKDKLPSVNKLGQKAKEVRQEAKQYTITLERGEFTAKGDIQDTLGNLVTNLLRDDRLDQRYAEAELASDRGQAKNLLNRINQKETDVPVINFIDKKGKIIAYAVHAPGSDTSARARNFKIVKYKGGPLRIRNPYDSSVLAHDEMLKPAGMAEVAGNMVDDHFNPARAYPTYRVYAIEEDREKLVYSDDFYGINCVSSIEIHHSKKNASLAVLRITNTTGAFENDAFLDLDSERLKEIAADDEGEQYFSSFRFRTGTLIQVRMGYTSKAEDLPIVFAGRVVETQFGPIVTLVCQGHRAEMFQDIEMAVTTMDPFQILDIAFRKIGPAPSLGRTAKMGEISQAFAREALGAYAAGRINWWGKLWRHDINSHMRNVFLQSNSPIAKGWLDFFTEGFSGEYKRGTGERLRRFANWIPGVEILITDESFDQWVCPQQPMWNMVQELARHIPGTIAHVVPFEQDGTLFFGKPTTPYIYSNPPLGQKRAFDKMYNMTKKVALTDLSHLVLDRFLKSRYFATFEGQSGPKMNHRKIKTKQEMFIWADKSFQNATRLLGVRSKSGLWNILDSDLHPAGPVAGMDFLGDWLYITKKSPGLARAMFGFWFGLSNVTTFPGTLEGDYGEICRWMCARLKKTQSSENDWTPAWQQLESQYLDSPNSPLNIAIEDVEVRGGIMMKGMVNKMLEVIDKSYIELSQAKRILRDLEATGRFPQDTIDELKKQLNERDSVFEEFELDTYQARRKNANDVKNILEVILGGPADVDKDAWGEEAQLAEIARMRVGSFRLFVFFMAQYLRESMAKGGPDAKAIRAEAITATLEDSRSYMLPPGWKQFRDYHVVTSKNDIIENKITATMEEMHNAVLIRHPHGDVDTSLGDLSDTQVRTTESTALHKDRIFITEDQDWTSFPKTGGVGFRPTIGKEYRKLLARVENNANSRDKAARCLLSNMAEALRPMYRGTLLIMGRVMKPYDVVHVNDEFTDMLGPIEVDEVIHHFNSESGWTTTIVPHALVHAVDNISSLQHDTFMDWLADVSEWYADNWLWVEIGLFATAAFTGGGSLAVGALIRGGARLATRAALRTLGKQGIKKVLVNRTLRRAFFRAAARTVSRAGGRSAVSKTGEAAVKTALAKNPKVFFGMLGRFLNAGARTAQAVSPWAGLSAVSFQALFATTHIKARWGSTEMPVDIQPLMLKGRPFTAGLEYGYDDTYNFMDKFKGFVGDFYRSAADGVEAIGEALSGVTETSAQNKLLDPD
jgi:micrococcal nuclease